jgi:hypothetical protein
LEAKLATFALLGPRLGDEILPELFIAPLYPEAGLIEICQTGFYYLATVHRLCRETYGSNSRFPHMKTLNITVFWRTFFEEADSYYSTLHRKACCHGIDSRWPIELIPVR